VTADRTMKGFRKRSLAPFDMALDDLPIPSLGPGEVLVQVAACGICGGDVHAYHGDPGYQWLSTPVILGHEFSGTVAATAADVAHLTVGQPVIAMSVQGCNRCATCAGGLTQLCPDRRIIGMDYDGGLAGFARVPAEYLIPFDPALDLTTAALTEPLSVAVHATSTAPAIGPGARVVVSGPGPVGLLCALVARAAGAEVLVLGTAVDERRLGVAAAAGLSALAPERGATAQAVADRFAGAAPQVWIEASGAPPAARDALAALGTGGQLVVVAMFKHDVEVSFIDAVRKHLTVSFCYAANAADYERAIDLLTSGAVDVSGLLDVYPLSDALSALDDAANARAIKAVVRPEHSASPARPSGG